MKYNRVKNWYKVGILFLLFVCMHSMAATTQILCRCNSYDFGIFVASCDVCLARCGHTPYYCGDIGLNKNLVPIS